VTVLLRGVGYELTTLRGEVGYSDGRRPDQVFFVDDITRDLARRDFTVNAMAYAPLSDTLVDPFDGWVDLQSGLLRAVGDASERFAEDGLRVLRAARFVATLEMELETGTERAIRPSLETYRKVSPERIREEWLKALRAQRPSRAFRVMHQHGLLDITVPEFMACAPSVWEEVLATVDACPNKPLLRLAALLGFCVDSSADSARLAEQILDRLRFSNTERKWVRRLVEHADPRPALSTAPMNDTDVRRWLRAVGPDLLEELEILCRARHCTTFPESVDDLFRRAQEQAAARVPLETSDLAIGGKELMGALGRPGGPWVGQLLSQLLEHVLHHPEDNQPAVLLQKARDLA
jgi:tRNA nucleotidyltransferase (CCA-adding enzyme)